MKLTLVILLSFCICLTRSFSQNYYSDPPVRSKPDKTPKPENEKTNFEIGGGVMGSVLYLSRNIKDKNDAYGYSFSANYGGSSLLRLGVQYTYYSPINIAPTWYNVHASTIEVNLEMLARFRDNKSFLYPFIGLSYNTFSGYFTGLNDYLNLKEFYTPNTTAQSSWLGVNLGTGFEHAFGPVILFLDYRMRVGHEHNNTFNIMDVCYGAGLRVKFAMKPLKRIFRKPRERYKVDK